MTELLKWTADTLMLIKANLQSKLQSGNLLKMYFNYKKSMIKLIN